jgi:hypothetical protein
MCDGYTCILLAPKTRLLPSGIVDNLAYSFSEFLNENIPFYRHNDECTERIDI